MSSSLEVAAVDGAFRSYLKLAEDEVAHIVFLASVLCNFDPARDLPIWFVLVGVPGSGKSKITRTILDWSPVHQLPNPISPAYLLSSVNKKESALYKIAERKQRILWMGDMKQFVGMRNDRELRKVYPQLLDLHDGRFRRATGFSTDTLEYDADKTGLLGWVGSGTLGFYRFQDEAQEWGTRFMVYNLRAKRGEWNSTDFLRDIEKVGNAIAEKAAGERVRAFLDDCVARIGAFEFERVKIAKGYTEQIRSAVTLVQRSLATGVDNDPGVRLYKRIVHIVRMIAFMSGKNAVTSTEAIIGCRIATAQIPHDRREIISFAMINREVPEGWSMAELCQFVGGIRQLYIHPLQRLVDVGLLDELGKVDDRMRSRRSAHVPVRYQINEKAARLIDAFDPTGVTFDTKR